MPIVRIDDAVMAHLREHGRFGDTYNDVLRGLLGLPPPSGPPPMRPRPVR